MVGGALRGDGCVVLAGFAAECVVGEGEGLVAAVGGLGEVAGGVVAEGGGTGVRVVLRGDLAQQVVAAVPVLAGGRVLDVGLVTGVVELVLVAWLVPPLIATLVIGGVPAVDTATVGGWV